MVDGGTLENNQKIIEQAKTESGFTLNNPPEEFPDQLKEKVADEITRGLEEGTDPKTLMKKLTSPNFLKNPKSPTTDTGLESQQQENNKERKLTRIEIISALIREGIITSQPSRGRFGEQLDYTVDVERAIAFLEEQSRLQNQGKKQEKIGDYARQKIELQQRCQALFKEVVRTFKNHGVLTERLVSQMDRFFSLGNISITDEDYHRFIYLKSEFPSSSEDEPELQIGIGLIQHMEKGLREELLKAGINISDEKIKDVAIRWGISHEFGHLIDRLIRIINIEKKVLNHPEREIWRVAQEVEQEIDDDLIRNIAPDEEIAQILKEEPKDGIHTSVASFLSESFASGCEFIGLREALIDAGITPDQVDTFMSYFMEKSEKKLQQLNEVVTLAKEKGISIEKLGSAINNLAISLREENRLDLRKMLPLDFGLRQWGYEKPFSLEEIKAYVSKYV